MRLPRSSLLLAGAFGATCALVPSLAMWGFTVDDALIPVRYAHHLATGVGYRFDAHGPSTDGVTPLPWPFLLAPFARGDALATLTIAKAMGVAAWTFAGGALGVRAAALGGLLRATMLLLVVALAFPVGAWAASGLETGVVTALATLAATSLERPRRAATLAGLAAALRPELAPWAVAVAIGAAHSAGETGATRETARRALSGTAIALGPFVAIAAVRLAVFGRAAPLAVLAKPSDLAHGATYAGAAAVVVLTPLFGSFARGGRALSVAFLVHLAAVTVAGGDWMPYARLVVPVAPSLVLAFAAVSASRAALAIRLALAALLGTFLAVRAAPAGRQVGPDRAALIAHARPALADARVVAALDIGWVSAATDATIVDLAGLTDPTIAALPGGHTSKRVDTGMLLDRGVDTVLVYSDMRAVEGRLVGSELFRSRYERVATLPLGARGAFYEVYRRRPA